MDLADPLKPRGGARRDARAGRGLHDPKLDVLRAVRIKASRRGRYIAGELADGRTVRSYADEEGVDPSPSALSVGADESERAWRVLAPVLAAWEAGEVPLEEYAAGSDGQDVATTYPTKTA